MREEEACCGQKQCTLGQFEKANHRKYLGCIIISLLHLVKIIAGISNASIVDLVLRPHHKPYIIGSGSTHACAIYAHILDSSSMSESKVYPLRQVEACQIGLGHVEGPETRSNDGRCFVVRTCTQPWSRRNLKSKVRDDVIP